MTSVGKISLCRYKEIYEQSRALYFLSLFYYDARQIEVKIRWC